MTLPSQAVSELTQDLDRANRAFRLAYPGDAARRQPVHTLYGGAHLFKASTARRMGALALRSVDEYAPDADRFAGALSLTDDRVAREVYRRVVDKLRREPVEDLRIDFEDGYGIRPDGEEDAHATAAGVEVATAMAAGSLPPFIGVRIKPLTEEMKARSLRTLDLFLTTLLDRTAGVVPQNFAVTLPKVVIREQPAALARILDRFESARALRQGTLRFEIMVETAQAIMDRQGHSNLPLLLEASAGRLIAAHFGAYDYTASCGIIDQRLLHPACDAARSWMQLAFAGTGVWLSDGATSVLPLPIHRGEDLSPEQAAENRESVHQAWKLHYSHVRHSLENGFYQGWDLHPAQLPARYAAVFAFYLEKLEQAATRLQNFVKMARQATATGNVFDDAATGQGLLNFFLHAVQCGAITEREAEQRAGLTADEFRSGSFLRVVEDRSR